MSKKHFFHQWIFSLYVLELACFLGWRGRQTFHLNQPLFKLNPKARTLVC